MAATKRTAATKKTAATKRTAATKHTAATKRTQDEDVIARLADKGEETVRWLVSTPRRMVFDVRGGVDARLHELASKLRAIDPLDGRVAELERRLASLEKPAKKPTRGTPTRAKPRATRGASTTAAAKSEPAEHDRGARHDATASNAERDDALAAGANEPTR
jgi:hypothetical protein